jgi:hypothetical protein
MPVDSSSIAAIGYDPEHRGLDIEFKESGEAYRYFEVPPEEQGSYACFFEGQLFESAIQASWIRFRTLAVRFRWKRAFD